MTEETEIIPKPAPAPPPEPNPAAGEPPRQTVVSTTTEHPLPESQFGRISIRAWLSIMVVGTACYTVILTGVMDETFKMALGLVVGLYFGQKK